MHYKYTCSCIYLLKIVSFSFDQKTVNDTTVSSVSEQLLNISRRAREYTDPLDVMYAAEVVDKLAQVIGRDEIVRTL